MRYPQFAVHRTELIVKSMNRPFLASLACLALAAPAHATGGFVCRTADAEPLELTIGMGHVAGSPIVSLRLRESDSEMDVQAAQYWLDDRELRLLLTDPDSLERVAELRATRNGATYDGWVERNGKRRWIRCREG